MIYYFEDFELDAQLRLLRRNGEEIEMEPQVFDVLQLLVANSDRIISKDELVDEVWNGRAISDTAITSRISSARRMVNDDGNQQRLIKTIYNKGLRFLVTPQIVTKKKTNFNISQTENPSIAVFSLRTQSGEERDQMIAEAIADEIAIMLTVVDGLTVVPRLAVGRNVIADKDPLDVARDYGAEYVVTGSMRKSGNRLRILIELTSLNERNQVWSQKFDGTLDDIFEIEDEVTSGVVSALGGKIVKIEAMRAARRSPESLKAWELARRAHAVAYDWRPETMAQGVKDCRRAIELDPNYAHAHVYLGLYLAWQIAQGWSGNPKVNQTEAIKHAELALNISGKDAEVLSAAGETFRLLGLKQKSLDLYENAMRKNPDIFVPWPFAIPLIGVTYAQMGHVEKGLAMIADFEETFPSNDLGELWSRVLSGYVHLCGQDYERVAELHANPPSEYNAICWLIALMKLDRVDQAKDEFQGLKRRNRNIDLDHYIDHFKTFHIDTSIGSEFSAALSGLNALL